METKSQQDSKRIARLDKQGGFLLRVYEPEVGKDPTSRATESSRNNMIVLRHTIAQTYGEAADRELGRRRAETEGHAAPCILDNLTR
jgi:hypothetical protein